MKKTGLLFILFCIFIAASARIRLPAVISDHMVLQRNSSVKIWGWGEPNEKVVITTSWNNKIDSTLVNGNAKWEIIIPTAEAGGPYTIELNGHNDILLENILIGEVWICSGQSNMEMNYYWGLPQMKNDIPLAFNSSIRFFHVPKSTALSLQENGEGNWTICDTTTVKSFSAVAYYFGKKLNDELNVPIGLIHASWGGTPAEAWTPSNVIDGDEVLKVAAKQLNPSGSWPVKPGLAFNSMIAPLTNFSITGAIWYQGESNTGTAFTYHQLFSSMIQSWRNEWGKQFPFLFVQLAPYAYWNKNIGALLREAQAETLDVPGTGMVVTTDIGGDTADIHPRNKKEVGFRLARLALLEVYHKNIAAHSPSVSSMHIEKDRIVVTFKHTSGLMQEGKTVTGFFIAGNDGIFYPAEAKIDRNMVTIWNKMVKQPVAVRYAFSNTAAGNVFDYGGLPVAPFRTDKWKVDTSPVK